MPASSLPDLQNEDDFILPSGLDRRTSFSALYRWIPLRFLSEARAAAFMLGGEIDPETMGPFVHEVTHFWYSISPVYDAVNHIRYRAIHHHYSRLGNPDKVVIHGDTIRNFLRWRLAEAIEQLLAPVMEGAACLAEFDAPYPPSVSAPYKTPSDKIAEKSARLIHCGVMGHLSAMIQAEGRTPRLVATENAVRDFDEFFQSLTIERFAEDSPRADRKRNMYLNHPLMMREAHGAHLLGYLAMREMYFSIIDRQKREIPLSLFLHALRIHFLFDEELVMLILAKSEELLENEVVLARHLDPVKNRIHTLCRSVFTESDRLLKGTDAALQAFGAGYGLSDKKDLLPEHMRVKSQVETKLRQAGDAIIRDVPSGVASRIAGSLGRRSCALIGKVQAKLVNRPKAKGLLEGTLQATFFMSDGRPVIINSDAYPLPPFKTDGAIDVFCYVAFVEGEPVFVNTFKLNGRPVLSSIGTEAITATSDEEEAAASYMNAEESADFRALTSNIDRIGELKELAPAMGRLDDVICEFASNIYLNTVTDGGPLGQLYKVMSAQKMDWRNTSQILDFMRRDDLVFDLLASKVLKRAEWNEFVGASLAFGLGVSLQEFDKSGNVLIHQTQKLAEDKLSEQGLHMIYVGSKRVYSLF